jgi:hypothetical protein
MSYGIELARTADDALAALPGMVAHSVLSELEVLSTNPVGLGKRSHFPFLPGRQMYQFWVETDGRWWITLFFRFSVDEKNIIILDIAAMNVE